MANLILAVNAGSSSLKLSVFRLASPQQLQSVDRLDADTADGLVVLIASCSITSIFSSPKFSLNLYDQSSPRHTNKADTRGIRNHMDAFSCFLGNLRDVANIHATDILYVCHRVVHGGNFHEPMIINKETRHHIERLSDLAPLHNHAALFVIEACMLHLWQATSIAYFDTTFHRDIPQHISSYAINQEIAKRKGLKKYGFHGISYSYILRTVSRHLSKPISETNLIVLHLGSGASVCVIRNGKSLDTSMGFTPLSGLPGATRSGTIDPALVFHYTHNAAERSHDTNAVVHVTEAEAILNKKSGWQALAGTSDFGEIIQKKDRDEGARLAYDLFEDRVLNMVGAYWLKLSGKVDALVFSGGIGEKGKELRESVIERCACIGFVIDRTRNDAVDDQEGDVVEIGKDSQTKVLVCRTDEQLEMARKCALEHKFWK